MLMTGFQKILLGIYSMWAGAEVERFAYGTVISGSVFDIFSFDLMHFERIIDATV